MTTPTTHPLTPREKVELKPCPFCGDDAVSVVPFKAQFGGSLQRAQCACGVTGPCSSHFDVAAEAWNRRTALASGSGDHAELAAISSAIGTVRFMDPPDGGDVPLSEQVRRMASALTEAERKLAEAVGHASWMRNFVPTVWGSTEERLNEIDAFLSKEAERG